jgi:hypothetical protein
MAALTPSRESTPSLTAIFVYLSSPLGGAVDSIRTDRARILSADLPRLPRLLALFTTRQMNAWRMSSGQRTRSWTGDPFTSQCYCLSRDMYGDATATWPFSLRIAEIQGRRQKVPLFPLPIDSHDVGSTNVLAWSSTRYNRTSRKSILRAPSHTMRETLLASDLGFGESVFALESSKVTTQVSGRTSLPLPSGVAVDIIDVNGGVNPI